MRKAIVMGLIAATVMPVAASAQPAELRHDRQDIRQERRDVRDARRDYREDWRDYRRDHRDVYRRPAYVGPRGYVYRPVVVGYRFAPAYYGSRYVIADPWRYRLPPATGFNRWIRYGNDVVLVNSRNGVVIEVHRGFFW